MSTPGTSQTIQRHGFRGFKSHTRRLYDLVAGVYPLSSKLFHAEAHKVALSLAGIRDGMRVLEVATGSGEMFRHLARRNTRGLTCGVDLSPNMAAKTQRDARRQIPGARSHCQAVDASRMPFRDGSFDAVVSCYLLELLGEEDLVRTIDEMHRVLRPRGRLILVNVGQNLPAFNAMHRLAGTLVPGFWGRMLASSFEDMLAGYGFKVQHDRIVQQGFYPSRVMIAQK
ncbi:MAG TPA: class I SAM-dependent methyltransferase [Bryobacteraceae bacterium]|jgi:ubiquinone/menaquinone biosynthesis C-methylase UbiE